MGKTAEFKTVALLLIGFFILVFSHRFPDLIYIVYNPDNFLSIHILMELFSVAVAFAIVIQGWMIFPHNLSLHRLYVSALFLSVGILDILHILTYNGMPFFLVDNSVQHATWFWIFARFTVAVGALLIFIQKDRQVNKRMRMLSFSSSLIYTVVISTIILAFPNLLPKLIMEDGGLTSLKVYLEYLISFFFLISLLVVFYHYKRSKHLPYLSLITSLGFGIIAEFIFTLYSGIYDFENLLGHSFKVISYYFLLKGVYSHTIEEPYLKQKETQRALLDSENRLNTIVRLVPAGIAISDTAGKFTYVNTATEEIFEESKEKLVSYNLLNSGWEIETLDGKKFSQEDYNQSFHKQRKKAIYKLTREDGKKKIVSIKSAPVFDQNNRMTEIIKSITDITELMQAQEKNHYLAYHDELTGLLNRNYFKERLIECFHQPETNRCMALLVININRFKKINDSLGNDIGDLFLQTVAKRLGEFSQSETRTIARMSADEFAVILEDRLDVASVIDIAKAIVNRLQEPMKSKGFTFYIDVAVGISTYDEAIADEEQLLQYAFIALHEAKRMGQPVCLFKQEMNATRLDNILLENELRQAIERDELTLYYQPQIHSQTGKVIGVEALIRWIHPKKGLISPGVFIPLAEESGLIVPIGKWVLNEACKQLKAWHNADIKHLRMSVNLSLRQFFQDDLVETVAQALQSTNVESKYLVLEITESLAMNVERAIPMLKALKDLGIKIAIDDFGTGYSSFNYLHQLPIDQLKIDQSFIRNLSKDLNNEAIVETIITLGHHLKLDLTAEGVETKEQLAFLQQHQCNGIQGFLISKPLPANEVEPLLRKKTEFIRS